MWSIQEISPRIKDRAGKFIEDWGLILIVLLVGLGSFGLGRLSSVEEVRAPVSISQASAASAPRAMNVGGLLVASRGGSSYFFPWCSGASKISEQNKVWFGNVADAQKAGYAPAKNCKGLK